MIAYALYRAGFIESWGRGIQKIKDSCKESGNSFPNYTISADEVIVEFKALNCSVGQDVGQDVGQEKRKERIMELIRNDNRISKKEIALKLGVSEKTIERTMKTMTKIKYVGSGYSGHWDFVE